MDVPVGVLRAGSSAMRVAPKPVVAVVRRAISLAIAGGSPDERRMAERNLRRAGVDLDGRSRLRRALAVQRMFDSYGRYWVDTLRLPHVADADVLSGFTIEGREHLDAAAPGAAPILALPHLGGWEWAARWLVLQGYRVAAVVERLEPQEVYEWFVEVRESLGMHVIPLSDGAGSVAAAISAGEIVCLLSDRDLSGSGIEVEFFGERTTLPGGPALMALRSGVPLLPAAVYFRGEGCHAAISPPLDTVRRGRLREDVARVTQDLAWALESLIRRAPEQWHLLQPNWPSDRAH